MLRKTFSNRESAHGFTLIEAIVALALVAIVLAAVGSVMATNARGARNLAQHVALMEATRQIVSTIPRGGEPLPGELTGEMLGHRWQMRTSPFVGSVPGVPGARFVPQTVELRVRSPSGAILALETVRLQEENPP